MTGMEQRLTRLEKKLPTEPAGDGVRMHMPWSSRQRILEDIDAALGRRAAGEVPKEDEETIFDRLSVETLRSSRVRMLGDGPGSDWYWAAKGSLITLPPEARRQRLHEIFQELNTEG